MGYKEIVKEQREEIVKQIISDMEEFGFDWIKPWSLNLTQRNAVSNRSYNGCNRLHLAYVARKRGFTDPRWLTFKQAKKMGYTVKQGAKSAVIEHWKMKGYLKPGAAEDGSDDVIVNYPALVGIFRVFNAEEIEGIEPFDATNPLHIQDETSAIIDTVKKSSRCPINESTSADEAFYSPIKDYIEIPTRDAFISDNAFLSTLLHEMTHSTGHTSVLNRETGVFFGTPEYAFEELVAELGSCFSLAELGFATNTVDNLHYTNHVAYLESWLEALQNDTNYIFKASSKADEAASYLMKRYEAVA